MKVYVITKGSYSDYHIVGVTTGKDVAERIVKRFSNEFEYAHIEEYYTDTWDDILKNGSLYNVSERESGEVFVCEVNDYDVSENWSERNKVVVHTYKNMKGKKTYLLRAYVVATGEEHAKKIACDLFAQWRYKKAVEE